MKVFPTSDTVYFSLEGGSQDNSKAAFTRQANVGQLVFTILVSVNLALLRSAKLGNQVMLKRHR